MHMNGVWMKADESQANDQMKSQKEEGKFLGMTNPWGRYVWFKEKIGIKLKQRGNWHQAKNKGKLESRKK